MEEIIGDMKLAPISFPPVLNDQSVLEVKRALIDTYKMLSNLAKIDTHNLKVSAIKQLVDKRCDDLLNNTSNMIDSILNRKKNTIILDRLLINDPITGNKRFTVDPNEIKESTRHHFQNFALPDTASHPIPSRWINQYRPKDYISSSY